MNWFFAIALVLTTVTTVVLFLRLRSANQSNTFLAADLKGAQSDLRERNRQFLMMIGVCVSVSLRSECIGVVYAAIEQIVRAANGTASSSNDGVVVRTSYKNHTLSGSANLDIDEHRISVRLSENRGRPEKVYDRSNISHFVTDLDHFVREGAWPK